LAISRTRKEELLEAYRQQMAESSGFLMAEYTALSVPQMQAIRRRTREQGGEVFVVKNTLFGIVLQETNATVPEELLIGPMVVAFAHQDVPSLAKLFREIAQSFEENRFVIKGGMLEGRFFDAREAGAVAALPTRDELLAQVLRTINAPATQTVGVIAGGIRQVLNVVKAYADKLGEAEGGTTTTEVEAEVEAEAAA
jgi:large subunit ribosomal protein L10